MIVTLYRHAYLEAVTLGRLVAGDLVLPSLEEPWIPNPAGPGGMRKGPGTHESCVPDGSYRLRPHTRPRDGARVWALVNPALGVYYDALPTGQKWGRTLCLIHRGNTTDDIEGCILVGTRAGTLEGLPAVLDSGVAMDKLRAVLEPTEEHTLVIQPTLGTTERGPL